MQLVDALRPWKDLMGCTEAFKVETAAAYTWTQKALQDSELPPEEVFGGSSSFWGQLTLRVIRSYPYRPMYRLDQARVLRYELEMVRLSREPYYTVRSRLEELDTELGSPMRPYFLTSLILPALPRVQFAVAKARAELRATTAGLACETYRADTGSYPTALDDLVPAYLPELPVDPFTGTPLLYRLTDEEVAVYSVGKNGTDDGSYKEETGEGGALLHPGADDVAWRVPR
jgi:hypothetical protein